MWRPRDPEWLVAGMRRRTGQRRLERGLARPLLVHCSGSLWLHCSRSLRGTWPTAFHTSHLDAPIYRFSGAYTALPRRASNDTPTMSRNNNPRDAARVGALVACLAAVAFKACKALQRPANILPRSQIWQSQYTPESGLCSGIRCHVSGIRYQVNLRSGVLWRQRGGAHTQNLLIVIVRSADMFFSAFGLLSLPCSGVYNRFRRLIVWTCRAPYKQSSAGRILVGDGEMWSRMMR
jgi:hypothetical protein